MISSLKMQPRKTLQSSFVLESSFSEASSFHSNYKAFLALSKLSTLVTASIRTSGENSHMCGASIQRHNVMNVGPAKVGKFWKTFGFNLSGGYFNVRWCTSNTGLYSPANDWNHQGFDIANCFPLFFQNRYLVEKQIAEKNYLIMLDFKYG